jgi:excisionase family DNA binding protein
MTQKKETIYDAEKLAKFFGITKQTARGWCKKGKLPAFKIGKEWKIRVTDLQKMIDQEVRSHEDERSTRLF